MTIVVVPTNHDVPLIQDVQGTPAEIAARSEAFFRTAEFLSQAGAEIEVDELERAEARAIFNDGGTTPNLVPSTSGSAIHLKALITEYDHRVLESNIQARTYIVNRLLDLSNPNFKKIKGPDGKDVIVEPPRPSEQIKALEVLGKVSEIGLFTEKIEININNKSTEELENELVQTLTKYMGQAVPANSKKDAILDVNLDEELGRI